MVLCAVSLSWSLAYDLTPAQERPFVDSTSGNSMFELVVGHNFIQRFVPWSAPANRHDALFALSHCRASSRPMIYMASAANSISPSFDISIWTAPSGRPLSSVMGSL